MNSSNLSPVVVPPPAISGPHAFVLVPQQFATIQAAIDVADGATTILVAPGRYAESLRIVDKPYVVIQSTHLTRRGVTLCGGAGRSAAVVAVERSTVHLSGIEVRSNARMRGLWIDGSTLSFQDCVIAGNRIRGQNNEAGHQTGSGNANDALGAGVWCRNSRLRVQKTVITGNHIEAGATAPAGGAGLYLFDSQVEIAGCTVQANSVHADGVARGGGLWCEASTLRMWRSRVTDNALHSPAGEGGGIYVRAVRSVQLGGSVITGNGGPSVAGGGVFIGADSESANIHRNTVVRQNFPNDVERSAR